jgi:hypothetical protein
MKARLGGNRSRAIGWLAVLTMLALAALGPSVGSVAASHVTPTVVAGNPDCEDLGFDFGFKVDPPLHGDYGDDGFTVHVDFLNDGALVPPDPGPPNSMEFWATPGVDGVFVKGGPEGNLYEYDPPANHDDGLVAPNTPSGGPAAISHVWFCYNEAQPTEPPPTEPPPTEPPPTEPPPEEGTADIVVVKALDPVGDLDPADWLPGEGWEFDLTVEGGSADPNALTTDANGEADTTISLEGETAGVEISETLQTDFELLDAACFQVFEEELSDPLGVLDGTSLSLEVESGGLYVCQFVNGGGEVQALTPTPTPPATDAIGDRPASAGPDYRIILVALAAVLALVLTLTPVPKRIRR